MAGHLLLLLLVAARPSDIERAYHRASGEELVLVVPPIPSSKVLDKVSVYDRPQGASFPVLAGERVRIVSSRPGWYEVVGLRPFLFRGWVRKQNVAWVTRDFVAAYCGPSRSRPCLVLPRGVPYRRLGRAGARYKVVLWGPELPSLVLYLPVRPRPCSREFIEKNLRCKRVSLYSSAKYMVVPRGTRVKLPLGESTVTYSPSVVLRWRYWFRDRREGFLFVVEDRTCLVGVELPKMGTVTLIDPPRMRLGTLSYYGPGEPIDVMGVVTARPVMVAAPYPLYIAAGVPVATVTDYDPLLHRGNVSLHQGLIMPRLNTLLAGVIERSYPRLGWVVLMNRRAFSASVVDRAIFGMRTLRSRLLMLAPRSWEGWASFTLRDVRPSGQGNGDR